METDTVIADAEPVLRWLNLLESLNIAFSGFQIARQRMQDTKSGGLIDGAKLNASLIAPYNMLAHD